MISLNLVCYVFSTFLESLQPKWCVLIYLLLVKIDFIGMSSTPNISTGDQFTTEDTSTSTPVKISTHPDTSTSTSTSTLSILYSTLLNKVLPTSDITPMNVTSTVAPTVMNSTSTLSTSILYSTLLNKVSPTSEITPMNVTSSVAPTVMNSTELTSARVPTSSILSSTCKIPIVPGGVVIPTGAINSTVVISCFSGFSIQGASLLQCVNGSWNFHLPTCMKESHLKSDVHNKINVNDIGMPTWLLWTLCAVLGLFGLLLLCCMLYICLKMCGCATESFMGLNQVHPYATRRACCTCCRDGFYHDDGEFFRRHRNRQLQKDTELTFSLPNEKSAKGHSRRIRTLSDSGLSSQQPESPETDRKLVVKVRKKSRAKSIPTWLPHSHPMRNINTSTK